MKILHKIFNTKPKLAFLVVVLLALSIFSGPAVAISSLQRPVRIQPAGAVSEGNVTSATEEGEGTMDHPLRF